MKSGAMVFKIYKNGNKYNFPWYFLSLVQLLIVSRHRLHCIWPTILLKKFAFCFHLSIHLKIDKHSFKLLMSCYCQKWKYFFFFFFWIITVQFVVSGVTQTGSSPIFSSGTYNYWPNRTGWKLQSKSSSMFTYRNNWCLRGMATCWSASR